MEFDLKKSFKTVKTVKTINSSVAVARLQAATGAQTKQSESLAAGGIADKMEMYL